MPNAKGAERAAEAGVDEIRVFVSASESHNRKNVNRSVEESLAGFEEVMRIANRGRHPGARARSRPRSAARSRARCRSRRSATSPERFRDLGMRGVGLGDTTGMATPPLVVERCRHLKEHVPELPIALHFHNTRGIGLVNVMAGLAEGIDILRILVRRASAAARSRPGATGNICTEDLVYLLHEMGIETGIDLERLCGAARHVEQVIGRTLPGQVMKAGPRLQLHPPGRGRRPRSAEPACRSPASAWSI